MRFSGMGDDAALGGVALGDIVISAETAQRQAKEAGWGLQEEMRFLLMHGILHLLGWKDDTPPRRRQMLARQREILEKL